MAEYPELLEELGGILGDALVRQGLKKDLAAEIAWDAVESVRKAWGGRPVYIPKAELFELAGRDQEIYELYRFQLWPYLALAKKYDRTEMRIRQIIKRVKLARRQQVEPQGTLFPVADLA